jgi:hypothetical protein
MSARSLPQRAAVSAPLAGRWFRRYFASCTNRTRGTRQGIPDAIDATRGVAPVSSGNGCGPDGRDAGRIRARVPSACCQPRSLREYAGVFLQIALGHEIQVEIAFDPLPGTLAETSTHRWIPE